MLALIGVDYKTAGIELREKISLTESKIKLLLTQLKNKSYINGAAVLSTCNRTEFYLSCNREMNQTNLIELFCEILDCSTKDCAEHIYIKKEEEVIHYLFELASGIHSMIFGDDQIQTQVGDAINLANEVKASDSILNTLFRHAVTCAKRVKTSVTLKSVSPSVATQAVDILSDYIKNKRNKRVLVIGNGEIGRGVSKLLVSAGCEVYMTLRTYKYKQNVVPNGCKVVEYEKRYELIPETDIIISATKSPHHTVSYEAVAECNNKPDYIMDLALPRDVDPRVGEIDGVNYYDIDAIGKNALYDNSKEISTIKEIVASQLNKFEEWLDHHKQRVNQKTVHV